MDTTIVVKNVPVYLVCAMHWSVPGHPILDISHSICNSTEFAGCNEVVAYRVNCVFDSVFEFSEEPMFALLTPLEPVYAFIGRTRALGGVRALCPHCAGTEH